MTASHSARRRDPRRPADEHQVAELRRLVVAAFATSDVTVDEDYRLTAFVAQRPVGGRADTVVVELIDRGPRSADHRWQGLAYLEKPDRLEATLSTSLVSGQTAAEVIRQVADQITGSSGASIT